MRFICDVCPTTACEGQTVIIGNYEAWINHLLSPKHQAEQKLVMARKTYWPEAEWIGIIKNLPLYDQNTTELYVDVMMQLSEYGFIEAVHYGSSASDSAFIALQLYETKAVPKTLSFNDGTEFDLTVIARPTSSLSKCTSTRRRRLSSTSTGSSCSVVGTPGGFVTGTSASSNSCGGVSGVSENTTAELKEPKVPGRNRIKYDKGFLLLFCGETSMPTRFQDILTFPKDIISEEAKIVNVVELNSQIQWHNTSNMNPDNTTKFQNRHYRQPQTFNSTSRGPMFKARQ